MGEQMHDAAGGSVERAVRSYEAALVESGFLGRHAIPEEESDHLRTLRMQLLRQVEALPSASWPRTECEHCSGQCEVAAVHAQYGTDASPQFVTSRRRCPLCWGTGLTLNVQQPEQQERKEAREQAGEVARPTGTSS